jgi:hypothetical protein
MSHGRAIPVAAADALPPAAARRAQAVPNLVSIRTPISLRQAGRSLAGRLRQRDAA